MRQLTPPTNLLLAVLAGLGLLASLSLPWYASPTESPNESDGPVERGAYQVGQVFATGAKGMVDGSDGIGGAQSALIALVGVVAVLAGMVAANVARRHTEDVLRMVALAAPLIVLVAGISHPGVTSDVHIHYGLLVGLAASLAMANAAWHGASMRAKRAAPVRPRYGR